MKRLRCETDLQLNRERMLLTHSQSASTQFLIGPRRTGLTASEINNESEQKKSMRASKTIIGTRDRRWRRLLSGENQNVFSHLVTRHQ